eukprot:TRINITY_DN11910_c0_g3_i1.p1 TRINITY_DN11910_c0_g3~~TRINITY_DN11910_c0_g3_i1.p1  ORF type:complete len:168 (+),score=10.69 TRINITY_DN11910_c0_g3_i1:69-572(+)
MDTVDEANNNEDYLIEKRAAVAKRLAKTRFCKQYSRNNACSYGEECRFAHNMSDLNQRPDWRKTRLCRTFEEGSCPIADCNFAHGMHELRQRHSEPDGASAGVADESASHDLGTRHRETPSGSSSREAPRGTDLQNDTPQIIRVSPANSESGSNLDPLPDANARLWQ